MDADERSDPNESSPPDVRFLQPDWAHESDRGHPAGATSGNGHRSVMRELASRWWQIVILWFVASTAADYLIYANVEPTYEAVSLLRVEPMQAPVYSQELRPNTQMEAVKPYLQTLVSLIKSATVLEAALASPAIKNLPMVVQSKDAAAEVKRDMVVTIVGDNTYLIKVALGSQDPVEAAAIVNAVVDAYLEQHGRHQQTVNRALKKNFEAEQEKLEKQILATVDRLGTLAAQGPGPVLMPQANEPAGKGPDEPLDSSLLAVTEAQFVEMTSRLLHADFELMDARARLETAMLPKSQASAEKIRELEAAVEGVRRKRTSYGRYMARIKVHSNSPNTQPLEVSLMTQDLQYLKRNHEVLKSKLAQIEFEIRQAAYMVEVQDRASVPSMPSNTTRLKYMAVAPIVILFLLIGLSLLQIALRRSPAPAASG